MHRDHDTFSLWSEPVPRRSYPHLGDHPHTHNGSDGGEHLHSHPLGAAAAGREEREALATTFIEGFRQAADKTSWLRLAGIPFELAGSDGLSLRLVDVEIAASWQVATASPGFGSRELVYLPFPGPMVKERTNVRLTYVSLTERRDVDLMAFLADPDAAVRRPA